MKTIVAPFSEASTAYEAAQALHQAGLDAHYIKVITRPSQNEAVVATIGQVTPPEPGTERTEGTRLVEGKTLEDMLRLSYGADKAAGLLSQVQPDGRSFLIAQSPEYLVEQAVETVRRHLPEHLAVEELAWTQFAHPGEPSGFVPPPTPQTADFYGPETGDASTHEVQPELEYADRRSLFFDHFRRHYAASGRPFSHYAAAYRFGYKAAGNGAWREKRWAEVETAVQTQWEQQQPATWASFQPAVHHGWVTRRELATEDGVIPRI